MARSSSLLLLTTFAVVIGVVSAQYNITTSNEGTGFVVQFFNGLNPDLTLVGGATYTFVVSTPLNDAVCFQTTPVTGGPVFPGASPACANNSMITLTVPQIAPLRLYYHSATHNFGGVIHVKTYEARKQLLITTPDPNTYTYTVVGADATVYGVDPDIYLDLNTTYALVIQTSDIHPVVVQLTPAPLGLNLFPGAEPMTWFNQGVFTLKTGLTPITIYFVCEYHGFYGRFLIGQSPPVAPEDPHFTSWMLGVWLICGTAIIAILVKGWRDQQRGTALLNDSESAHTGKPAADSAHAKAYSVLPDDSKRSEAAAAASDKLSLNSDKR